MKTKEIRELRASFDGMCVALLVNSSDNWLFLLKAG